MKQPTSSASEVDAITSDPTTSSDYKASALAMLARKLTRERDAAIAVIEAIEEIFIDGENTHDDWLAMGTIAREFLSENADVEARQ